MEIIFREKKKNKLKKNPKLKKPKEMEDISKWNYEFLTSPGISMNWQYV